MIDFSVARQNMVAGQLRPNRVHDAALLDVVARLPREVFLPASRRGVAYVDEDVPLGNGRYLMEPLVLCRLIQAAQPKKTDVALDIGCTTGYSTALLAGLVNTVIGIDDDPALIAQAETNLSQLGIDNAALIESKMTDGCPGQAPYDIILMGGQVEEVPPAILAQLAEGGRLLAVFGDGLAMGQARIMYKFGGALSSRPLFDAGTPPLPGFGKPPRFVF